MIRQIAIDYRQAPVDPATRALLDFGHKLSRQSATVSRRDWDTLLATGWTEPQIIEAVHIVGMFEYANRVAEGLGMESHGADRALLLEDLHVRSDRQG